MPFIAMILPDCIHSWQRFVPDVWGWGKVSGTENSTGFLTFGLYQNDDEAEDHVIRRTHGYSRNHRTEKNQVVLQLISSM